MKRKDFKQIIKLRSIWKIDARKGDYQLPSGHYLSHYIDELVEGQMQLDHLAIMKNGDLCFTDRKGFGDYKLLPAYGDNEDCLFYEMERRIREMIIEIIENR